MKRIPKITQENVHIFIPYKAHMRCLKKKAQSIGTKALRSYMRTLSLRMGICDGI